MENGSANQSDPNANINPDNQENFGADTVINPTINPSQQPQPQSNTQQTSVAPGYESIVLSDTGYLQNALQRSVTATTLSLTLYNTHLRIDNGDTGQTLEDVPLSQIKRTSRYFSSRLLYTLYTLLFSNVLVIKTDKKKYKISWVNRDKRTVLLGALGAEVTAQENYTKNMTWVKTIRDLQHK